MTSETDSNENSEPVDAEFEPATVSEPVVHQEVKKSSGPGWLSLGVVGAMSAGALGLSYMNLDSETNEVGSDVPSSIVKQIEALQSGQSTAAADLAQVKTSTEEAEKRMAAQIEALLSGDEQGEGLAVLVQELEAVSGRLDEAMTDGPDSKVLDALADRISALEEADESGASTPRDTNRAMAALRERVSDLEVQSEQLEQILERRSDTINELKQKLDGFDAQLKEGGLASANGEQEDLLANLQSELDNLKTTVERTEDIDIENEKRFTSILRDLQSVDAAEEKANEAATTANAALALSRIEAAAREGKSFHAAFEQLQEALPNDKTVASLKDIATSGAPTIAELSQDLELNREAALEVLSVEANDGWGWTRQVFGGGVKVRRADEDGGPSELFNQAEAALISGNLKNAVVALEELPEESKAEMADWLDGANARLTLEEALKDIGVKMIGRDR